MVKLDVSRKRWPGRLIQVVFGLAVAALIVGGVIAVGNVARDSLGPRDRYLLPFTDIECPVPPGQSREEFLEEVRYIEPSPEKLNVLDPTLPDRLHSSFSKHKRVERVAKVSVFPPKRIVVELTFRPSKGSRQD